MDTIREIEQLDQQIVENQHAIEANAVLRARRQTLQAAEAAEQEAQQRARERHAATLAVRDAEESVRLAEAEPLRAEFDALNTPLAEIEHEVTNYIWKALADARRFHARYLAAKHAQLAVAVRLEAIKDRSRPPAHALTLAGFVLTRLQQFHSLGSSAAGPGWAHEDRP